MKAKETSGAATLQMFLPPGWSRETLDGNAIFAEILWVQSNDFSQPYPEVGRTSIESTYLRNSEADF